MLLELQLDYRSSSQIYEKIFLRTLKALSLEGTLLREHFTLKLYIHADTAEELENFSTHFSSALPHSIFLYDTKATMVEKMPTLSTKLLENTSPPMPYCPTCLEEATDREHENYYNIFTACEVCGYGIEGEKRSYQEEIKKAALSIQKGEIVELNTFYGKYFVALPNKTCHQITYDILCYDLATVEKYTYAKKSEITSLGAIEKPLIKLKKKLNLVMDYEDIQADLLRFKLPDDFILFFLMEELHQLDIHLLYMTKEHIAPDDTLLLVNATKTLEPIEVVASENDITIISGDKGLPKFPINAEKVNPPEGSFYSVIKEHHLENEIVAGIHLSRNYKNNVLIYGKKFGTLEYLSFEFKFDSMQEIFENIHNTNETGVKILENFKKTFPEHYEKISTIVFEKKVFNLYTLWGIMSIILDFTKTQSIEEAARILEEGAMSFLGEKGPRIDYKLLNIKHKIYLDPLMTIRTAMSFKLAGVDQLTLSYGIIESFLEFIANEFDEVKQNMGVTAITVTGSLLGNRNIFSKMSKEIAINHNIYFNNELTVEGKGMFYGGNSLS